MRQETQDWESRQSQSTVRQNIESGEPSTRLQSMRQNIKSLELSTHQPSMTVADTKGGLTPLTPPLSDKNHLI